MIRKPIWAEMKYTAYQINNSCFDQCNLHDEFNRNQHMMLINKNIKSKIGCEVHSWEIHFLKQLSTEQSDEENVAPH